MNRKDWKVYALSIVLTEATGAIAAFLTREGTKYFNENVLQPPLSPPQWVFPVVWGILYALMGIGAARIWLKPDSAQRRWSLNLFVIQLALNFFWTLIFFNAMAYALASGWVVALLLCVGFMTQQFSRVDRTAAALQVPYLIWLSIATYLCVGVWVLN